MGSLTAQISTANWRETCYSYHHQQATSLSPFLCNSIQSTYHPLNPQNKWRSSPDDRPLWLASTITTVQFSQSHGNQISTPPLLVGGGGSAPPAPSRFRVNSPEKNAYDLLGVSETSSFAEIKASFRRLAKETHPDLTQSLDHSSDSHRFVQILAAYEILSDSEKRTHYDRYLLSQRMRVHRCSEQVSVMYTYESHRTTMKEMEVVEWLKWYRFALNDILSEKRIVVWSGYFDLLPDCFEAEERSAFETPEVLHLVSGRDLFGMISLADKVPELSQSYNEKLSSFASRGSGLCQAIENISRQTNSGSDDIGIHRMQATEIDYI
ncbi:uncharacterized protein LOC114288427 isoform X2 [Camellia sinensis]|uniref:uncharacterized protein LOC114288427 isoform X2 n=1 Tax=Camellia sinensis TaxID=4442 RepID=UPI0010355A87|nr:uncharacterized protein LOC114288427 isoform X2 [Camellia sinensis]